MKKIILLILPILTISKECENIKIDFFKENKTIYIKEKSKNYTSTKIQRTKNKNIFKIYIGEYEYYNTKEKNIKLPYYQTIKIINNKNIKLKYTTAGSKLIIYAPQKEIIENFEIKACRPYKKEKWIKLIRKETKESIEKRKKYNH